MRTLPYHVTPFILAIIISIASSHICAATSLQNSDSGPMPQYIFTGFDARHPQFIEASLVIGQGGKIKNGSPLSRSAESHLHNYLDGPRVDGCIAVGEFYHDYINAPRRGSLAATISDADFVLEGRVVTRSYGFMDGVPGQLLRIRTHDALKTSRESLRSIYYIFVPVADFTVAGVHFCKTDRRYPTPPEIGDTLFVFVQNEFVSDGYINTVDEAGYVRVLPSGVAVLPRSLRNDGDEQAQASEIRRLATASNNLRVGQ